jgi:hypothetical protein
VCISDIIDNIDVVVVGVDGIMCVIGCTHVWYIYMYVCVCVCVCVRARVCVCARARVCVYYTRMHASYLPLVPAASPPQGPGRL